MMLRIGQVWKIRYNSKEDIHLIVDIKNAPNGSVYTHKINQNKYGTMAELNHANLITLISENEEIAKESHPELFI